MKQLTGILAMAAVSATLAALAVVGTVSAHAHYVSSTPAKGAVLTAAPASVAVTFAEEIQNTAGSFGLTVRNEDGASAAASAPALAAGDATTLTVGLKSGLADGRYEVRWNNVSSVDGDAAEGAFSFYVGTEPTAADLAADEELAMIGEEEEMETPMPEITVPAAAPTVPAAAPQSTPAAAQPAAGGTLPRTGDGSSAGRSDGGWITAAAVLAAAMLALGGGIAVRRRA